MGGSAGCSARVRTGLRGCGISHCGGKKVIGFLFVVKHGCLLVTECHSVMCVCVYILRDFSIETTYPIGSFDYHKDIGT